MTNNPQQSIDEVLERLNNLGITWFGSTEDGIAEAKAALKEVVDGIIGLDEYPFISPEIPVTKIDKNGKGHPNKSRMTELGDMDAIRRNDLRSEQRNRAAETFGDYK